VTFTARLEEELDEIEEGKLPWREAVKEFWEKFVIDLDKATTKCFRTRRASLRQKVRKVRPGRLLERISRHGFFLGCSRYPECDFIQDLTPVPKTLVVSRKSSIATLRKEMVIKRGMSALSSPARVTRL